MNFLREKNEQRKNYVAMKRKAGEIPLAANLFGVSPPKRAKKSPPKTTKSEKTRSKRQKKTNKTAKNISTKRKSFKKLPPKKKFRQNKRASRFFIVPC